MILVSFVSRKNKNVLLVSSMHINDAISQVTKKPEIIDFYNMTKGAVDTCDQMIGVYSISRSTRRYPLKLFFHITDSKFKCLY